MKIVIACDSFKGSVSSTEAGDAVAAGVRDVYPDAEVIVIPMADGGEGTAECAVASAGGSLHHCLVEGPAGQPVRAGYGIIGRRAVIESAQACGLTLIPAELRNPAVTSSYGVGELILDAIGKGCREIVVGLGGSATNDGGAGMLQALGFGLYDATGSPIGRGGIQAGGAMTIDKRHVPGSVLETEYIIATDVSNPLCGPQGASITFAPQKGATPEMAYKLDESLAAYAATISSFTGHDCSGQPGAGAAGGLGFALLSLLNARCVNGADLILDMAGFDNMSAGADLIITGEGRLDRQTLMGKAPGMILSRGLDRGIPVIAVCGQVDSTALPHLRQAGFAELLPITDPNLTLVENMRPTVTLRHLRHTISRYMLLHRHGDSRKK